MAALSPSPPRLRAFRLPTARMPPAGAALGQAGEQEEAPARFEAVFEQERQVKQRHRRRWEHAKADTASDPKPLPPPIRAFCLPTACMPPAAGSPGEEGGEKEVWARFEALFKQERQDKQRHRRRWRHAKAAVASASSPLPPLDMPVGVPQRDLPTIREAREPRTAPAEAAQARLVAALAALRVDQRAGRQRSGEPTLSSLAREVAAMRQEVGRLRFLVKGIAMRQRLVEEKLLMRRDAHAQRGRR